MSNLFQPYLASICAAYAQWWQLYTLTDAAGKQQQAQETAPVFDFGLMVQSIAPQKPDVASGDRPDREEKMERFGVLEGLREYAAPSQRSPHVLLVGRPGSGKSTALARLMLEEAADLVTDEADGRSRRSTSHLSVSSASQSAALPVLVELRYWQGSIVQLILNALARHGLALRPEQLESVWTQALLLFDGVNELPSEEARSQKESWLLSSPLPIMPFDHFYN